MKKNKIKIHGLKSYIDDEMRLAAINAINSGNYILGDNCKKFEEKFSNYIGIKHGILTNSATSALHLSLIAMGVGKGDEVIVPSLTAFPTIEPIFHTGAKPVFIDVNDEYVIDDNLIQDKITEKTKGIIPVHLYGNVANMKKIASIAKKNNLFILEDASQAHGSEFLGKKAGSFGEAACFSFYPSKNMTFCGDGGISLTDDEDLYQKIYMLRNHGRKDKFTNEMIGFNMRCNEIQAAIGLVQLKHIERFIERRREIAGIYSKELKDLPIKIPQVSEDKKHSYHLYVIQLENRNKISNILKSEGIPTGIHYPIPCHLQPAVTNLIGKISLPRTEEFCNKILSLPIYPEMRDEEVEYVCDSLKSIFN
ncbi:aminotransferase class V-fold PLP-dependent enzyme [Candidatus Pacearchaeota archaeon]|nr:aminotransferase class V-fold PLP-dependent enzyme [Candidatus Pacearchaeota archaeon]MBD3282682.1 aminotransferase class V-fold PLP-dependent enzyme [Candidatus Pacearchaeota archaeon]